MRLSEAHLPFNCQTREEAATIVLLLEHDKRLPRLIEEYSEYPPEMLRESILKIKKRLGGDNTADALKAVDSGDFAKAIDITLRYYDKAYIYGLSKKRSQNIVYIETETDNVEANTMKILDAAGKIKW